jgi:hypothetical protein
MTDKILSEDAKKAEQRPDDYDDLTPSEQWDIDAELGILDWDGK